MGWQLKGSLDSWCRRGREMQKTTEAEEWAAQPKCREVAGEAIGFSTGGQLAWGGLSGSSCRTQSCSLNIVEGVELERPLGQRRGAAVSRAFSERGFLAPPPPQLSQGLGIPGLLPAEVPFHPLPTLHPHSVHSPGPEECCVL